MKLGGYDDVASGFTIVEVMIVLAVSSLLLISAIALIDGRQSKTEFTTGINDEQQQIEQIINETSSGYYPNNDDFSCASSATGPVTFSSGASKEGTNAGCIFLGKVVQFGLAPPDGDATDMGVLPIVGNQFETVGGTLEPVLSVAASVPRAAYPINSGETNVPSSTKSIDNLEYGIHVATSNSKCGLATGVCYMPATGGGFVATGIAGFLTGESDANGTIAANAAGSGVNLQSGTQQLSLYGVKAGLTPSTPDQNLWQASNNIGDTGRVTGLGYLVPASEVLICLASGSTNQSGLITIGGVSSAASGNGGLNVTLTVLDGTTC